MEGLATLFVAIVTVVHITFPQVGVNKVLGLSAKSAAINSKQEITKEEKIASRSARKKELVETIKGNISDKRKQAVVENIGERIGSLNIKWVDRMTTHADKLANALTRIDVKAQELSNQGIDTSSLSTAISEAKVAIAKAQEDISIQEQKTYTIALTSETGIGQDVKVVINSFHNDIKNTKDSVILAQKAVKSALSELKKLNQEAKSEQ